MSHAAVSLFRELARAQSRGVLIPRATSADKEFHFQDWVEDRIAGTDHLAYKETGRNGFPDFVLTDAPEGFEVKGLESPGRSDSFDSNSRLPVGRYKNRDKQQQGVGVGHADAGEPGEQGGAHTAVQGG